MKGISVTNPVTAERTPLGDLRLAAERAMQSGDVALGRQLQEQWKARALTFRRLYNTLMDAAANAKAR